MPEGDRFERVFRGRWRGAYRLARQDVATPAEIGDKCASALAKTLRDWDGIPGFRAIEDVVGNAAWRLTLQTNGANEEAATLIEAFETLDRIVRDQKGHRHTRIASESAKSMLIQQGNHVDGQGFWPMRIQFAENACKALAEHYFFATARQNLVAEGKIENHDEARQWQNGIMEPMRPGIKLIAEKLGNDPCANNLRASNRTVKRQSTIRLLEEVLITSETLSRSQDGH